MQILCYILCKECGIRNSFNVFKFNKIFVFSWKKTVNKKNYFFMLSIWTI